MSRVVSLVLLLNEVPREPKRALHFRGEQLDLKDRAVFYLQTKRPRTEQVWVLQLNVDVFIDRSNKETV